MYVARINRETEGDALGEQSYRHFTQTGHKPRNYHSPGVSHPLSILETKASLTVLSTCLQGYCACCCAAERGRGQGQVSKEVTAGWLVLALTCDTDLVPQALLLQLFGVSNAQHKISHAWKCLKLRTLSQHFLNEAPARPPGQQ